MDDLERAVQTVLGECLRVHQGEHLLVIADTSTRELGEVLRAAGDASGADAVLAVMAPRAVDGEEPPPTIAAALAAADVYVAPTSRSLSHTRARKWATDAGVRGATLPGVTEDILARLMACDLPTLRRRSRALAQLFSDAGEAHFTCPRGSDLRLELSGRHGIADDGDLSRPGAFGNLPCGEGFISPCGGEGTMVATSLAGIGLVTGEPATLTIAGGRLTGAAGPEGLRLLELLHAAGSQGTNLAELGVGTNERAGLIGNVIEDEKVLGTVHVAFGASAGIGGTVSVPIHLDCVVVEPTLDIGGVRVIEGGEFVFGA